MIVKTQAAPERFPWFIQKLQYSENMSDMKKIINWYNTLQSAGLIQLPKEKEKTKKEK